jgi:hypothetical protein
MTAKQLCGYLEQGSKVPEERYIKSCVSPLYGH